MNANLPNRPPSGLRGVYLNIQLKCKDRIHCETALLQTENFFCFWLQKPLQEFHNHERPSLQETSRTEPPSWFVCESQTGAFMSSRAAYTAGSRLSRRAGLGSVVRWTKANAQMVILGHSQKPIARL